MSLEQVQKMIITLGINQEQIMKYINENFDPSLIPESPQVRQPLIDLMEEMNINFYQQLQMYAPLVNTHRDITYSTETVQLHSHSFYEIIFCEGGDIQYLIGDSRYSICPGDIIVVPPGTSHRPIFSGQPADSAKLSEPYSRIVLWVSSDFIENLRKLHQNLPFPSSLFAGAHYLLRTKNSPFKHLRDYFTRSLTEAQNKKPGWESMLYHNTGLLLTELWRIYEYKDLALPAEQEDDLDRIISYIENNYTSYICLEETAKQFLISKSTLSKLFQSRLGISFYRFVTQRRLIHAKKRMEDGEALETIGISCGFNDYATFYRAFKKEYGLSPRDYQKLHKR